MANDQIVAQAALHGRIRDRLSELRAAATEAADRPRQFSDPDYTLRVLDQTVDLIVSNFQGSPLTCHDCDEPVPAYRAQTWDRTGDPVVLCRACYADREDFLGCDRDSHGCGYWLK